MKSTEIELSIRELARVTGYTPGHISRIARGEKGPSLRCLVDVARALGVTLDEAYRVVVLATGRKPQVGSEVDGQPPMGDGVDKGEGGSKGGSKGEGGSKGKGKGKGESGSGSNP